MQTAGDILVVDDDEPTVMLIAEVLGDEGYTVRTALTSCSARAAVVERRPDLILADLHLDGSEATVLVRHFACIGIANVPVILMTADTQAARELSMDGIALCLSKPFDLDELIDSVAKHIRRDCTI